MRFGFAGVLLGFLAYLIAWASIWDQTSDGLVGVMFSMWVSLTAIAAGILMGFTASNWHRSSGLIFALLVPLLLFGAFRYGWAVSYHEITDKRANQIQHAIESFHIENGTYPEELRELVPNYLFWIPEPVILRGESWCYQGGREFLAVGCLLSGILQHSPLPPNICFGWQISG
jgi:hypothetical protein